MVDNGTTVWDKLKERVCPIYRSCKQPNDMIKDGPRKGVFFEQGTGE
jgi:hypothetical protein